MQRWAADLHLLAHVSCERALFARCLLFVPMLPTPLTTFTPRRKCGEEINGYHRLISVDRSCQQPASFGLDWLLGWRDPFVLDASPSWFGVDVCVALVAIVLLLSSSFRLPGSGTSRRCLGSLRPHAQQEMRRMRPGKPSWPWPPMPGRLEHDVHQPFGSWVYRQAKGKKRWKKRKALWVGGGVECGCSVWAIRVGVWSGL